MFPNLFFCLSSLRCLTWLLPLSMHRCPGCDPSKPITFINGFMVKC